VKSVPVEKFLTFLKYLGDGMDRLLWMEYRSERGKASKEFAVSRRSRDIDHRGPPRFIRILVHVLNLSATSISGLRVGDEEMEIALEPSLYHHLTFHILIHLNSQQVFSRRWRLGRRRLRSGG
jgi:hypothetical protein